MSAFELGPGELGELDTGLRELLGEIARDPRARLLRVSRSEAALAGSGAGPAVSSAAPFLRRAERRLLEVYREEIGRLLYDYAVLAQASAPELRHRVHYADCSPLPDRGALDRRTRGLAPFWARDLEDLPAMDLLRASLRQSRWVAPTQLTAACLRVAPAPRARILHASNLALLEHMPRESARLLHGVLAQQDSGMMASYALENMSVLESEAPSLAAMALLYEKALRADPRRLMPALGWLRHSLQTRSLESVLRAAEQVDAVVPPGHPALEWYLALELVPGQVTREVSRLARVAEDLVGPVARQVLEFALAGAAGGFVAGIPALPGAGRTRLTR